MTQPLSQPTTPLPLWVRTLTTRLGEDRTAEVWNAWTDTLAPATAEHATALFIRITAATLNISPKTAESLTVALLRHFLAQPECGLRRSRHGHYTWTPTL